MRLIDADKLTQKMIVLFNLYGEETPTDYVLTEIENAPTVERPHGEWLPFEWDSKYENKIILPKGSTSEQEEYWAEEFVCSVCGHAHHWRNFCPNCGADMREGEAREE